MKKFFKTMAVLATVALALAAAFTFTSCSSSDDENNSASPSKTKAAETSTTGSVAAATTSGGSTTATLTASNGSYTFTETTGADLSIGSRNATVDTSKGGTWTFTETGASSPKYSGTYKGDISQFGSVEVKLTLTVTKILSDGSLKDVSAETEFSLDATTETFSATIPAVSVKPTTTTGTAAFAATILTQKVFVKFNNDGTYVQWMNGSQEGKGTYELTGDFTNGTMTLTETQQYKNGSWKTTEEIIECRITNGVLSNRYGSFVTVSPDYDVSQDLPNGGGSGSTGTSEGEAIQLKFNSTELNNKIFRYYIKGNSDSTIHYVFTENKCYKGQSYTSDNAVRLADNYLSATSDTKSITVTKKGDKYYVSENGDSEKEITLVGTYTVPSTPEECAAYAKRVIGSMIVDTTTKFETATKIDGTTDLIEAYPDGTFKFAGLGPESTLYLLTPDRTKMACFVKRSSLNSSLISFQNDGYIMIGYSYLGNKCMSELYDWKDTVDVSVVLDNDFWPHSLCELPVKFLPAILKGYKIYRDINCTEEITDWNSVLDSTTGQKSHIYAKPNS